jgi:hypothetical protein
VDPVARIEDELLHLGVPPFGLVPEVDTAFQQFLHANADHIFLWLKVLRILPANHPAEHGIIFSVIMATRAHSSPGIVRPFAFTWRAAVNRLPAKKGEQTSKARPTRNLYFRPVAPRRESPQGFKQFFPLSEDKRE